MYLIASSLWSLVASKTNGGGGNGQPTWAPRSNLHGMREILGPLRAAAITAFITGLALLLLNPPSLAGVRDLLAMLVGAVAFVLVAAWATVALIGDEMPEPE